MALGKYIIQFSAPATHTHGASVSADLERIRNLVCKTCGLSLTQYDEAHYDLAESWFIYHGYLEYTARVFMVSKTYHRWWNQQVASLEDSFLRRPEYMELNTTQRRESLFVKIVKMDILPASELRRKMHEEGTEILRANPSLAKLKIYRHV